MSIQNNKSNRQKKKADKIARKASEERKVKQQEKAINQAKMIAEHLIAQGGKKPNDIPNSGQNNPEGARPKGTLIFRGSAAAIVISLLILALGAPFNFYGGHPWILFVPALAISVAVFLVAHENVRLLKKKRDWYALNLISPVIFVLTIKLFNLETIKLENETARRNQEHDIITSIPDRLKNIESGATNVAQNVKGVVEGTRFTHEELLKMFPYGYSIIYFRENKRFKYEVFKTGKMEWKLDFDKITIEPHIDSGTVTWTIPNLSGYDPEHHITVSDFVVKATSPFKAGRFTPTPGVISRGEPRIYIGTLNDNQKSPLFIIGFRIPAQGE